MCRAGCAIFFVCVLVYNFDQLFNAQPFNGHVFCISIQCKIYSDTADASAAVVAVVLVAGHNIFDFGVVPLAIDVVFGFAFQTLLDRRRKKIGTVYLGHFTQFVFGHVLLSVKTKKMHSIQRSTFQRNDADWKLLSFRGGKFTDRTNGPFGPVGVGGGCGGGGGGRGGGGGGGGGGLLGEGLGDVSTE